MTLVFASQLSIVHAFCTHQTLAKGHTNDNNEDQCPYILYTKNLSLQNRMFPTNVLVLVVLPPYYMTTQPAFIAVTVCQLYHQAENLHIWMFCGHSDVQAAIFITEDENK
jgi:hypothetical protein